MDPEVLEKAVLGLFILLALLALLLVEDSVSPGECRQLCGDVGVESYRFNQMKHYECFCKKEK